MSDIKNVVFRNAISGYNKSDVNEFLVRSSAELMEREAAANERVKRAESELGEYVEKIGVLETELDRMRSEIAEKDAEIVKISAEKQILEDSLAAHDMTNTKEFSEIVSEDDEKISKLDFDKQEAIIAEQYNEIESLKAEIERLKEQAHEVDITKDKYDELVKKAALYDKTNASIGETLLSANKTAEEIISAAKEEARMLEGKAEKELAEKRRSIEETSKRAMESVFSKLSLAAAESRRDVTAVTSYTYRVIEKALEDIKSKASNSEIKIKSYEDSIWRGIKEDLNSISTFHTPDHQRKASAEQLKRIKK